MITKSSIIVNIIFSSSTQFEDWSGLTNRRETGSNSSQIAKTKLFQAVLIRNKSVPLPKLHNQGDITIESQITVIETLRRIIITVLVARVVLVFYFENIKK
jgi:hypothetical protein